nr:MAG TPA: hypothetical protein [Crassvirales sp.]
MIIKTAYYLSLLKYLVETLIPISEVVHLTILLISIMPLLII